MCSVNRPFDKRSQVVWRPLMQVDTAAERRATARPVCFLLFTLWTRNLRTPMPLRVLGIELITRLFMRVVPAEPAGRLGTGDAPIETITNSIDPHCALGRKRMRQRCGLSRRRGRSSSSYLKSGQIDHLGELQNLDLSSLKILLRRQHESEPAP